MKKITISLILILTVCMVCKLVETKERNERIHLQIENVVDSLITSGSSADAAFQKAIEIERKANYLQCEYIKNKTKTQSNY